VAIATGDTEGAIIAALAGVEEQGKQGIPATFSERLLPLAARASADQVQALRDHDSDPGPAVARLRGLQRRHPHVIADPGPGPMYQMQLRAMQALYDAEVLRGQVDPTAAAAWCHVAQACADAELKWDEAYARRRAAETLLSDRSARQRAVAELRRANEMAMDLEAVPLLTEIAALARIARVPLTAPRTVPADNVTGMPGLTSREREILAHLLAGRTYGEIARELVLSEKTVSVHVSHLLHKTGTANRIELAQLARRLASQATD
jgi:DNA-binding CsgD family transcriptional regulator